MHCKYFQHRFQTGLLCHLCIRYCWSSAYFTKTFKSPANDTIKLSSTEQCWTKQSILIQLRQHNEEDISQAHKHFFNKNKTNTDMVTSNKILRHWVAPAGNVQGLSACRKTLWRINSVLLWRKRTLEAHIQNPFFRWWVPSHLRE